MAAISPCKQPHIGGEVRWHLDETYFGSAASRHAYTLHVVDARARYSPANWLQRNAALPARGFV